MVDVHPGQELLAAHVTEPVVPALVALRERFATIDWERGAIAAAVKQTLAEHGLKMPQLANAVRALVCGRVQTPSLDAVLEGFERAQVLQRLAGVRLRI